MVVAYVSSVPTFVIHARDVEQRMLTGEFLMPPPCNKSDPDPTINDVRYKQPEHRDNQMDRPNDGKESEKISKTNRCEYFTLPYECLEYRDKFNNMVTELECTGRQETSLD